jgi:hypothetical protein
MTPERFVSAAEAAQFLGIARRFLLSLARKGIKGSYPIGVGDFRKRWIFKLSELAEAIDPRAGQPGDPRAGLPRRPPQWESRYDRSIRRPSLK